MITYVLSLVLLIAPVVILVGAHLFAAARKR